MNSALKGAPALEITLWKLANWQGYLLIPHTQDLQQGACTLKIASVSSWLLAPSLHSAQEIHNGRQICSQFKKKKKRLENDILALCSENSSL